MGEILNSFLHNSYDIEDEIFYEEALALYNKLYNKPSWETFLRSFRNRRDISFFKGVYEQR